MFKQVCYTSYKLGLSGIMEKVNGSLLTGFKPATFQFAALIFNQYTTSLSTFTFMHLADAFIQSDLHCIQVTVSTF